MAALMVRYYRGMSKDSQREVASQLRRAVKGQVLPKVNKAKSDARAAKVDGPVCEGAMIAGKYKLLRVMGMDGVAQVWKAEDMTLGRAVLIKRLYAAPEAAELRARTMDAAKKAAALHHPNIAELFEVLDRAAGLFLVYEYTSGKSIRRILKSVGTLPSSQILGILIPVCRALEHSHRQGIAHGGLSPERIVLTQQGYVKVTDFVLARTTTPTAKPYRAPEMNGGVPTAAADIFSLGACFLEMLTGKRPPYDELITLKLDSRIEELMKKVLDPDPEKRFSSSMELLGALQGMSGEDGASS
ncbi:serine/threonine protein kinase [Elusimicrobiota bacterium]